MKIRHHGIHYLKVISRVDENVGFAIKRRQWRILGSTLKTTHRCSADGNDATSSLLAGRDLMTDLLINVNKLFMHFMLENIFDSDRLEGSCPNMQGKIGCVHTLSEQCRKQVLVEMQSRCRSCYSSLLLGIDSLIALGIYFLVAASYIRRQRHMSFAHKQRRNIDICIKTQQKKFILSAFNCGPRDRSIASLED